MQVFSKVIFSAFLKIDQIEQLDVRSLQKHSELLLQVGGETIQTH